MHWSLFSSLCTFYRALAFPYLDKCLLNTALCFEEPDRVFFFWSDTWQRMKPGDTCVPREHTFSLLSFQQIPGWFYSFLSLSRWHAILHLLSSFILQNQKLSGTNILWAFRKLQMNIFKTEFYIPIVSSCLICITWLWLTGNLVFK